MISVIELATSVSPHSLGRQRPHFINGGMIYTVCGIMRERKRHTERERGIYNDNDNNNNEGRGKK